MRRERGGGSSTGLTCISPLRDSYPRGPTSVAQSPSPLHATLIQYNHVMSIFVYDKSYILDAIRRAPHPSLAPCLVCPPPLPPSKSRNILVPRPNACQFYMCIIMISSLPSFTNYASCSPRTVLIPASRSPLPVPSPPLPFLQDPPDPRAIACQGLSLQCGACRVHMCIEAHSINLFVLSSKATPSYSSSLPHLPCRYTAECVHRTHGHQ